eukprot:15380636-Alexandrium_andersonii.AAC.1
MPERVDAVPLDAPQMPPNLEEEAGDVDAVGDLSSLPPLEPPASPPRFAEGGASSSASGAVPPVVEPLVEVAPAPINDPSAVMAEADAEQTDLE